MKRVPVVAACAALVFQGIVFTQPAAAVGPQTDLSIAIQSAQSPVVAGSQTQYQVTTTNNGPAQAINVTTSLTLPAGITFASVAPISGCGHANGTITCTRATLDAGSSTTFTVTTNVLPDSRGTLQVSGTTTSNIQDTNQNNNARTVSTVVTPEIDLQLALRAVQPAPAIAGAPLTYEFTVSNSGRSTASNTTLDLAFTPDTIDSVTAATPGLLCEKATDTVSCLLGTVAPAGVAQSPWITSGSIITVEVKPKASLLPSTKLEAEVVIDAEELENNIVNNFRTHETMVQRMSDLDLQTVTSAPATASGDGLTYTFVAQNRGPSNTDSVVFSAKFPSDVFVVSEIQGPNCTRNGGTITCNAGTFGPTRQETITIRGRARTAKPATITLDATLAGASPEMQGGAANAASYSTSVQPLYRYLPIVSR